MGLQPDRERVRDRNFLVRAFLSSKLPTPSEAERVSIPGRFPPPLSRDGTVSLSDWPPQAAFALAHVVARLATFWRFDCFRPSDD